MIKISKIGKKWKIAAIGFGAVGSIAIAVGLGVHFGTMKSDSYNDEQLASKLQLILNDLRTNYPGVTSQYSDEPYNTNFDATLMKIKPAKLNGFLDWQSPKFYDVNEVELTRTSILNSTVKNPFKVLYTAISQSNAEIKRDHIVLFNVPKEKRVDTYSFEFSNDLKYTNEKQPLLFNDLNVPNKVGYTWDKGIHYYDLQSTEKITKLPDTLGAKPLIFSQSDEIKDIASGRPYLYWVIGSINPNFIGATTVIVYMGLAKVK